MHAHRTHITLTINGEARDVDVDTRSTLLDVLREQLGLTGAKKGCDHGQCGACTVLLDGRRANACLLLAVAVREEITTIEGLAEGDALHPVQAAFVDTGAIQCGFCTPAMELCAKALLDAVPAPDEDDVRDALAGCLCRCTGYVKPVEAVLRAARARDR